MQTRLPRSGHRKFAKRDGVHRQGVKDMVRISDARMSGTAFGTIVLQVKPESAVGRPLALVRTGDQIRLDVAARRIDLLVDDVELERRRAALPKYARLFHDSVMQADEGCDFDFMIDRDVIDYNRT